MSLPAELQHALEAARSTLETHPRGELPRTSRMRVLAALGPRSRSPEGHPSGIGYRRRLAADEACVRRVLPLWDSAHPDDDGPRRMLALADEVARGAVDPAEGQRLMDQFSAQVEALDPDAEGFVPGYVGDAAVQTVSTALSDYDLDPTDERLDEDLDPDELDAPFYAAVAVTGVGPHEPGDDAANHQRRRDFWRWYLDEAVPTAYANPVPE